MSMESPFSASGVRKWEKVDDYVDLFDTFVPVVYIFQGSYGFFYKRI